MRSTSRKGYRWGSNSWIRRMSHGASKPSPCMIDRSFNLRGPSDLTVQACGDFTRERQMEAVAGAYGHDVSAQRPPQQREIAQGIQDLVPRELVWKARRVEKPIRPQHQRGRERGAACQ